MDINEFLEAEPTTWTVPDRLRWTSDFLDLASKAISIIACAQGLDCPPEMHRDVQAHLRAWARYLDDRPLIAVELELASVAAV
jgi:hypothetical protein